MKTFFRGVARVMRTYRLQVGPVRATGVPAILLTVSGVVIAGGIAAALSRAGSRLPETLHEAQGLAATLRGEPRRLNS